MKRLRALGANLLLIACSLALALGITEVVVRLVAPQPTGLSLQDRYGLAMHWPGITRYLPQFGHAVSFNSAGMRDREHTLVKPAGTFRVILLGDSFIEALQVPFEASLPALIERGLVDATGRKVEVISAGVSGWGTDDALRWLSEYGLRYHPDLVLVAVTLHNDFSDNLRQEWHRLEGDTLVTVVPSATPATRYAVLRIKAWIATQFQTYQLWRRVRHGREIRQIGQELNRHVARLFLAQPPPDIARADTLTGLLLRRTARLTDSLGGHTAAVLIPIVYQVSDSGFAVLIRRSGLPPDQMHLSHPQQMVSRWASSLGLPIVDLLPSFRRWSTDKASALYLPQDGHWNEAGHRLAAKVVVQQLVEQGLVPILR